MEVVIGDLLHEPPRADIKAYGNFNAEELLELKKLLFKKLHVALVVAGAGPGMAILFNKDEYKNGVEEVVPPIIVPWFEEKEMKVLEVKNMEIAEDGAYDYVIKHYGYKGYKKKLQK